MNLDYEVFRANLPSELRPHCDPSRPTPQRLLAARGLLPLGTSGQLSVLVALCGDGDEAVRTTAERTLRDLPAPMLQPVIRNAATPPWLLEGLGALLSVRTEIFAELLSNRQTPATIHVWAGANHDAQIVHERLCNDLERLRKHPEIIEAMWQNPNVDRYILRPPVEFLVRQGIVLDSVALSREIFNNLSAKELEEAIAEVDLPDDLDDWLSEEDEEGTGAEATESTEKPESEEVAPDTDEPEEKKKQNLLQLIQNMTPAQKVALALKGNKEARSYLIEDSNKVVASATIRSPRLTLPEVVKAAMSRSVHGEVLRIICGNKNWMKQYKVRIAVINNPRTPVGKSMPLLKTLKQKELKALTRNTGIPSGLRGAAKRMLQARSG